MQSLNRLQYLLDDVSPALSELLEEDWTGFRGNGKWTRLQILGHLLDSATNNHHRFIRASFENLPLITYDQEKWNDAGKYNLMPAPHLVLFWKVYNAHLLNLLKQFSQDDWLKQCSLGGSEPVTLRFVVDDYVEHLEHHLKQIVSY